jgi:hypothetical protein
MNEEPKHHDGFFSWQPSPLNGEGHQKVLILMNVTLALEGRGLEPEANRFYICPGSRVRVLLTGPFRTMHKWLAPTLNLEAP